jgi:hypothetical protein
VKTALAEEGAGNWLIFVVADSKDCFVSGADYLHIRFTEWRQLRIINCSDFEKWVTAKVI